MYVDDTPEPTGGYILTGSHRLQLREAITQSLAGRTALLTLFPFALNELEQIDIQLEREILIHKGFMPRLHDKDIRPGRFYRDYFQTYVERDLRKLMAIENQQAFELFLKLLAGRVGSEINYSALSGQVGISAPQIKNGSAFWKPRSLFSNSLRFLIISANDLPSRQKFILLRLGLPVIFRGLKPQGNWSGI